MSRRVLLSSSVTMLIATPLRPKRPPRPILESKESEDKENGEVRSFSLGRPGHEVGEYSRSTLTYGYSFPCWWEGHS